MLDVLKAFVSASTSDVMVVFVVTVVVGLPLIVVIHEAAHALVARSRGLHVAMLAVGDRPDLLIRAGDTLLRLGRPRAGDWTGFVSIDPEASPDDFIAVAVAGPLANLITAPVLVAAAEAGGTHGPLDLALWIVALDSVIAAIANLVPRQGPRGMSDGRWIQVARAIRSGREVPVLQPVQPRREPKTRWPFVAALACVVVLALLAGGLALATPVLALFGYGLFAGWHRREAF